MSIEIRTVRPEEAEQHAFIDRYAFALERTPESVERFIRRHRPEWSLAAFDDGEMVACLTIIPFTMRINGAGIPLGGIASVACLPEHRRKGHVGRLLREALATMRDRGQALSALYTPHYALYRRFGWAVASTRLQYRFACKDLSLYGPTPAGRARRVGVEAVAALDDVHRRWIDGRAGAMDRSRKWWEETVFRTLWPDEQNDVAVWESEDGRWDGYVVYRTRYPNLPGAEGQRMMVHELTACTPDAYNGLVRYLLNHDLVTEAVWLAPPDDPFLTMLHDPEAVQTRQYPGYMLRLVDVRAALCARPYPANGDLVLDVTDAAAPWNEGRWRLTVRDGRAEVEPARDQPDLSLDAAVLATLYAGHVRPSQAALTGLLAARDDALLRAADCLFATGTPPFTYDAF